MRSGLEPIDESERNIDWEEVEKKVSIILYKFNNISESYRDDLAQELRIHAYYFSDDYYDLYRCAIDYWRRLTRKEYPEIPFIDMELIGGESSTDFQSVESNYKLYVDKLKESLLSEVNKSNRQIDLDKVSYLILKIICNDIDGTEVDETLESSNLAKFYSGRISLSYLGEVLPSVNYKKLGRAVKRLEELMDNFLVIYT
jgi:hypothetical protein